MKVYKSYTISVFPKPRDCFNSRGKLFFKQESYSFITSETNQIISQLLLSRPILINKQNIIVIPFRRFYSSKLDLVQKSEKPNIKLNPGWIIDFVDVEGNFIEWFVGFTDAEGSFDFIKRKSRNSYEFRYRISLHLDDIAVLFFIKENLGLGRVSKQKENACVYVIDKVAEIQKIINIFNKRPLNTTKHLNFLMFSEAFLLCTSSELDDTLHTKLESLRDEMNRKRTDFKLSSDHQYLITPYWFLGFVEGEGSFWISTKGLRLCFSLTQAYTDLELMKEISQFLNNLPGDKSDAPQQEGVKEYNSFGDSARVYISRKQTPQRRGQCEIRITNTGFIRDVLIPFFDSLIWHSKKHKDFLDWKVIFKLKHLGRARVNKKNHEPNE